MFRNNAPPVSSEEILTRVREEDIVKFYFNHVVIPGRLFLSLLRVDHNPTCTFSYHKGRLRFRDFSEPRSKDVWDLVREKLALPSYYETLLRVYKDFNVDRLDTDHTILEERGDRMEREKLYGSKALIQIKAQDFTLGDKNYLKQYGITRSLCDKYKVFSVRYVWISGSLYYVHTDGDPCLAYYFGDNNGEERWKLYFYRRTKKASGPRFICNTNRIAGWVQVPETAPYLILTKSLKDVMVLDRLGVPAISMQNEATIPYPDIIETLQSRFDRIYTLYDFDLAGVRMAHVLRQRYDLQPFFLTTGRFGTKNYGSKDISDYVKDHGLEQAAKLIQSLSSNLRLPWPLW